MSWHSWLIVIEIALIDVTPGQKDAFAAAYAGKAHALISATPGCLTATMTRGVESPSRFVGIVHWESIEAHLENFRGKPVYKEYVGLLSSFLAGPATVEHFTVVGE